jgi:hypothetical protein
MAAIPSNAKGLSETCAGQLDPNRVDRIDIRELRARAARRFTEAGIESRYVDTAVVVLLIADRAGIVANPLGYCLAVGRRLQDDSVTGRDKRRRQLEEMVANTCAHGSTVESCSCCAEDRARALELFPSLRRYLPHSFYHDPG